MKTLTSREYREQWTQLHEAVEVTVHGRTIGWFFPVSDPPAGLALGHDPVEQGGSAGSDLRNLSGNGTPRSAKPNGLDALPRTPVRRTPVGRS